MAIHRGFPILAPRRGALELFRPPAGEQLFRLTASAWATGAAAANVERIIARDYDQRRDEFDSAELMSDVAIPANDPTYHRLFARYVMQGAGRGVYLHRTGNGTANSSPYAVFAHAELGDDDSGPPARAFLNDKPASPFPTQFLRPEQINDELLIHQLSPGSVELVTLSVVLSAGMQVELRFYDGTYKNGIARSTAITLTNYNEDEFVDMGSSAGQLERKRVLDRHPMQGPGSIRAVLKAGASSTPSGFPPYTAYIYGGAEPQ